MKEVMTVIKELGKLIEDKNLTIELQTYEINLLKERVEELETKIK